MNEIQPFFVDINGEAILDIRDVYSVYKNVYEKSSWFGFKKTPFYCLEIAFKRDSMPPFKTLGFDVFFPDEISLNAGFRILAEAMLTLNGSIIADMEQHGEREEGSTDIG